MTLAQCTLEGNWPAGKTLAETIEDIEMDVDGIIEGDLEEVLLQQALCAYNDGENVTKEQYAALLDNGLVEEPRQPWERGAQRGSAKAQRWRRERRQKKAIYRRNLLTLASFGIRLHIRIMKMFS